MIGAPELLIFLTVAGIGLALLVFTVVMFFDAVRRTDAEFTAIGQNRAVWMLLLAAGVLVPGGFLITLAYVIVVKPRFAAPRPG